MIKRKNYNLKIKNKNNIITHMFVCMLIFIIMIFLLIFKEYYIHNNDNIITQVLSPEEFIDPLTLATNKLIEENKNKDLEISNMIQLQEKTNKIIQTLEFDKAKLVESYSQKTSLDFTKLYNNEPRYLVNMIIREWERHGGTDSIVPLAICKYESNFKTTTRNMGSPNNPENSWGLFQVNVNDKAHASRMGWSNYERLYDPVFNVQYQFPELVMYEKKGISNGLSGYQLAQYVSKYGQRPYWTSSLAKKLKNDYIYFSNAIIK